MNRPTVASISGGKSSAYIGANYDSDYLVFALVRVSDESCKYPDEGLRKKVEDRINAPFIGTAEMNDIIHTIFDLEQFIGKKIHWVTGPTFEELINKKSMIPSVVKRFCTTELKIIPIIKWAKRMDILPYKALIGYRAGEERRVLKMHDKCNEDGLVEQKVSFGKHKEGQYKGKNKWETVPFQEPAFPLVDDRVYKSDINNYWEGKPVRFAEMNNCVGCFHRNPVLLNKLGQSKYKDKMEWFAKMEENEYGTWKKDVTYKDIINADTQIEIGFDEFSECDSGYCGL